MTHVPSHERFITLTVTSDDENTTRDSPLLVVNPKAISSLRLSDADENGMMTLHLNQVSGESYSLGPLARMRARDVFRQLLSGLGDKNSVNLPEDTSLTVREA